MVRTDVDTNSRPIVQYDTMCISKAIALVNHQKDKEVDGEQWLNLHSMITTLCILKKMGFKRVQMEYV
jgi:hypothetical protein